MAELSRTQKYKTLRDAMQSDIDTAGTVSTPELSRFEKRLNRIDADNFTLSRGLTSDESYEGTHVKEINVAKDPLETLLKQEDAADPELNTASFKREENIQPGFDNDFLDQYIREVKEYNIAQGNAVSDKTSVNILHDLNNDDPFVPETDRPYPRAASYSPRSRAQMGTQTAYAYDHTADIPFMTPRHTGQKADDLYAPATDNTGQNDMAAVTKDGVMAEVQNLVNGRSYAPASPAQNTATNTLEQPTFNVYDSERNTRQQLLNETTQMRAQLDDYEDNLSEVTDKMRHTNNILNIVLIVLIIALIVILGIVVYIITLAG